jgi:hypothetical protein
MNKKILVAIIVTAIFLITWIVIHVMSWPTLMIYKQKINIIKESEAQNFFPTYKMTPASVSKSDTMFYLLYKEKFHVCIWKFNSLKSNNTQLPVIDYNVDLTSIDFSNKLVLDTNLKDGPYKHYRRGATFNNHLGVSVDSQCEISKSFKTEKYCGFYGSNMKKVLLSDNDGIPQVFIEYPNRKFNTLFLFGIKQQQLYVIFIDSENEIINENLADIFDFD